MKRITINILSLVLLTAPAAMAKGTTCFGTPEAERLPNTERNLVQKALGDATHLACSGAAIGNGPGFYTHINRLNVGEQVFWTLWEDAGVEAQFLTGSMDALTDKNVKSSEQDVTCSKVYSGNSNSHHFYIYGATYGSGIDQSQFCEMKWNSLDVAKQLKINAIASELKSLSQALRQKTPEMIVGRIQGLSR